MLSIEDVEQFHKAFGHPVSNTEMYQHFFKYGDNDWTTIVRKLRTNLIAEEVQELQEACSLGDPILYADALFDLLYVIYGAIAALGVPREIGDIVHKSNMSKLGDDGKPVYREDGKVLKGPNWIDDKPLIAKAIEDATNRSA